MATLNKPTQSRIKRLRNLLAPDPPTLSRDKALHSPHIHMQRTDALREASNPTHKPYPIQACGPATGRSPLLAFALSFGV